MRTIMLMGMCLLLLSCAPTPPPPPEFQVILSPLPPPPKFQILCGAEPATTLDAKRIPLAQDASHPSFFLEQGIFTIFIKSDDLLAFLESYIKLIKDDGGDVPDSEMLLSMVKATMPLAADTDLRKVGKDGAGIFSTTHSVVSRFLERGDALVTKQSMTEPATTLKFMVKKTVHPEWSDGGKWVAYCDKDDEDIFGFPIIAVY